MSESDDANKVDANVQAAAGAAEGQQTYAGPGPETAPMPPGDAATAPAGLQQQEVQPGAADPAATPKAHILGAPPKPPPLAKAAPAQPQAVGPIATQPVQPMVTGMLFGQSGDTDPVPAGAASSSTRGPSLKRTGSPTRGREAAASRGPRLDPPQQDYQPTDLPGYQPDLSEFDATTILPSPKGSPVRHDIATAENSPEKQRNGNGESDVMQNLVATMLAMQQSLAQLTQRIEKSETKKEDAPKIDHKDIQKPDKYSGPKWSLWSEEFKGFLRRRDKRWAVLLDEIQGKSKKPLTDDDYSDIQAAMGIKDEEVYFAFQQQLYEYLKSYTTGEPLSMVLANGVTKALESWRRMADQGRSARERPMRDERRALYHPKQAGLSDVIEAISSWEKKLAEYQRIKTKDIMSDEDKIMCLEDICPEVLQRHLSEQQALGQVECRVVQQLQGRHRGVLPQREALGQEGRRHSPRRSCAMRRSRLPTCSRSRSL